MKFSAGFLEVLVHTALVGLGIGLVILAVVFIVDSRGKKLW